MRTQYPTPMPSARTLRAFRVRFLIFAAVAAIAFSGCAAVRANTMPSGRIVFEAVDPLQKVFREKRGGVQENQPFDERLVRNSPAETDHPAPVLRHERDIPQIEPVDETAEPIDVRGHAVATVRVPEFAGSLRLMCVAIGREGLGSAHRAVIVKRDVVVKSSLPRFLAPGDVCTMPIQIFNESSGDQRATAVEGDERVVRAPPHAHDEHRPGG